MNEQLLCLQVVIFFCALILGLLLPTGCLYLNIPCPLKLNTSQTELSLFPRPYLYPPSQLVTETIISPATEVLNYGVTHGPLLFVLHTFAFYAFLPALYALSHFIPTTYLWGIVYIMSILYDRLYILYVIMLVFPFYHLEKP